MGGFCNGRDMEHLAHVCAAEFHPSGVCTAGSKLYTHGPGGLRQQASEGAGGEMCLVSGGRLRNQPRMDNLHMEPIVGKGAIALCVLKATVPAVLHGPFKECGGGVL